MVQRDKEDSNPATFERRYNEFLSLYNGLKLEFPNYVSELQFPRKVLFGNFRPEMILERGEAFNSLLLVISSDRQLLHSKSVSSFLQDRELRKAIRLIQQEQYAEVL